MESSRQFTVTLEPRELAKLRDRGIDTVEKLNMWIVATLEGALR